MGVVALGTGLFLLAAVGEGRLAVLATSLVERVDGRVLAEFCLVEPTSGWVMNENEKKRSQSSKKQGRDG